MSTGNITLPDELLPQLKELARVENKTADDIAAEAVRLHLVRRLWDRTQREATRRRGNLTDTEVDDLVNCAILEVRNNPFPR